LLQQALSLNTEWEEEQLSFLSSLKTNFRVPFTQSLGQLWPNLLTLILRLMNLSITLMTWAITSGLVQHRPFGIISELTQLSFTRLPFQWLKSIRKHQRRLKVWGFQGTRQQFCTQTKSYTWKSQETMKWKRFIIQLHQDLWQNQNTSTKW
jgi:hypothetical protein